MKSIKEIAEILSRDIKERNLGDPISKNPDKKAYPLNKGKFYDLKPSETKRKMAFVDGGNQRVLGTAEFSIQVNRVYFNMFSGKKRVFPKSKIPRLIEFISLTVMKSKNEDIYYETIITPVKDKFRKYLPKEEHLTFKATDRQIMVGNSADIERVASMARRFAEWEFSKHVIDLELDDNDILVRDGTLQTSLKKEVIYTEKAIKKAKEKGVIFTGLSKTSELPTSTGLSVISSIHRFADECNIDFDNWCYGPIFRANTEIHKAIVMAVKLNKNAKRIFRFEIYEENNSYENNSLNKEILDVVSSIIDNSNDIRFPGYPYGLYYADQWARVKNEEIGIYETQLKSELSKNGVWKIIDTLIKAGDAHEKYLDSL